MHISITVSSLKYFNNTSWSHENTYTVLDTSMGPVFLQACRKIESSWSVLTKLEVTENKTKFWKQNYCNEFHLNSFFMK